MGWRTLYISKSTKLSFKNGAFQVFFDGEQVSIPLEDIAVIVLDTLDSTITTRLLSECAIHKIVMIFVDLTHLPVGLILPLLPHSRVLKVLRAQMNASKPLNKRIHQAIITQKVRNQANVIKIKGHEDTFRRLSRMLPDITSGDSNNIEAQAAFIYFRTLFGNNFKRRQESIENSALNYAYTIVRSTIARAIVANGLLPALGIFHHNEQNAFNLADDLIEPFRPIVDFQILLLLEKRKSNSEELTLEMKQEITRLLGTDISYSLDSKNYSKASLLATTELQVKSLNRCFAKANASELVDIILECDE